eukprot:4860275-Lingulodinium_polyedra.AAC.1
MAATGRSGHARQPLAVRLYLATDNQGNSYSLNSLASRNHVASAILAEMAHTAHTAGILPAVSHQTRDLNTWADDLTNHRTTGFDPTK